MTNNRFSYAAFPGVNRLIPVSVQSDQLLCLPEPFTPAKGFLGAAGRCFVAMRRIRADQQVLVTERLVSR